MKVFKQILVLILFIIQFCIASSALAKIDYELKESQKCSNIFAYYEKLYSLPRGILHSIALKESSKPHSKFNISVVWPWTVNIAGKGYYFKDKKTAVKFTKAQLASGTQSIDVGCMQINLKHHPDAFASVEKAFSPRRNVEYGAVFLRNNYEKSSSWEKAIAKYHSGFEERGRNYHLSVNRIHNSLVAYKKDLRNYTNQSRALHYTKIEDSVYRNHKPKFLGIGKVGVKIARLKANDWFRKVQ